MVKIAVVLPTRGQMYSQTFEEIMSNLEPYPYELFMSWALPIPDCFNALVEKALSDSKVTHVWFVEEDMVLPKTVLTTMVTKEVPAIACDYPVTEDGKGAIAYDHLGQAIYTGTGCLLVTREFLEAYPKPIFRSDISWNMRQVAGQVELIPIKNNGVVYGFHDVTFGLSAYLRGNPIQVLDTQLGQRRLRTEGKAGTNEGQHKITTWRKVVHSPLFLIGNELAAPNEVNVELPSGVTVLVPRHRAEQLTAEGKATYTKFQPLGVEQNEIAKELAL